MFRTLYKTLTYYSNNYIDWSRSAELLQSANHHYGTEELIIRGKVIAFIAATTFLGAYLNDEEKTNCSNLTLSIAAGTLGFVISHAFVFYPLVKKRYELGKECKRLCREIELNIQQMPLEVREQCEHSIRMIVKRIMNLSLSDAKHDKSSATWGRRKNLLSKVRYLLEENNFSVDFWMQNAKQLMRAINNTLLPRDSQKELPPLLTLPPYILNEVLFFSETDKDALDMKVRLSNTGRVLHSFFRPQLNKVIVAAKLVAAAKLLEHVVKGKETEARIMLEANPDLLFIEPTTPVMDYSSRLIQSSAYQAAFNAEDVQMLYMMEAIFNRMPDGRKTALEQLPEVQERIPYDFRAILKVISENLDKLVEVIGEFRDDCKSKNVIKNERHFNIYMLVDACKLYSENFRECDEFQRIAFWRFIIGYIQRYLPACYAQAFCQGFYDVMITGRLARLDTLRGKVTSYYPLTDDGLGFAYTVLKGWAVEWAPDAGEGSSYDAFLSNFIDFCEKNTAALDAFRESLMMTHQVDFCTNDLDRNCVISANGNGLQI